jgi:hypothetical protein
LAQTFDGPGPDGKPAVFRPVLTSIERQQVLEYLRNGHFVIGAYSTSEDMLDPQRPALVPNRWVTDGPWVWPSAMAYYLDEHNVTPPPAFLAHIRAANYLVPEHMPNMARDRAQAELMGSGPGAALPSYAESRDVIDMVKSVIAGLRITKSAYSFDQVVEDAWCMVLGADGWWSVFLQKKGERKEEVHFHQAMDAAAHLVGCLTLEQDRYRRDPHEYVEDYECLLKPLPTEPPLSTYERKLHVEIHAGTEVDRIGDTAGNTVFVAGTAPQFRGMTPAEPTTPYHRYRVQVQFQAVEGYVKPDQGLPGGGQAFILPQSVAELVAGGWFTEVPSQQQ